MFNLLQGHLLNLMASVAGSLCFLTQFIRLHSLLLVNVISWILLSKKVYLAILTVFLYIIQSVLLLDVQYMIRFLLHSSFHYVLEYLVMLIYLKYLYQSFSMIEANSWVTSSSILWLWILVIWIQLILFLNSLMNSFFSSLFLMITIFSCE